MPRSSYWSCLLRCETPLHTEAPWNTTFVPLPVQHFVEMMWSKVTSPEERRELKPALVFQEIFSYLKGSAEAISGDADWLTLEQYLEVGSQHDVLRCLTWTMCKR